METEYTKKVLERYKKVIVEDLKKELGKPNSNLSKSIVGRKMTNKDGFTVSMNDYGLNVNNGRSAGKFPIPQKLEDWVRRNSSTIGVKDTSPSGIKRVSFLIGRSISRKGIRPTRFIDIVLERVEPKLTQDIANAYLEDLNIELDKIVKNVSNKT